MTESDDSMAGCAAAAGDRATWMAEGAIFVGGSSNGQS